jgi:hypothetical protein
MVEVKMRQDDVEVAKTFAFAIDPEPTNACTRIENDERAFSGAKLDTGRVAAVPDRFRTGAGDRSPAAPDGRAHDS